MLIFILEEKWYNKYKTGEKTVEYREAKEYWKKRLENAHCIPDVNTFILDSKKESSAELKDCILQCGYNPKLRLSAKIIKVELINGLNTDLAIDKPVYAIHLANIKELKL